MATPSFYDMFSLLNDSIQEGNQLLKNTGDGLVKSLANGGDGNFRTRRNTGGLDINTNPQEGSTDKNPFTDPNYNPLFDPNLASRSDEFLETFIRDNKDEIMLDDLSNQINFNTFGNVLGDRSFYRQLLLEDPEGIYSEWDFKLGDNVRLDASGTFDRSDIWIDLPDGTTKHVKGNDTAGMRELNEIFGFDVYGTLDPNFERNIKRESSRKKRQELIDEKQREREAALLRMKDAVLATDEGFINPDNKQIKASAFARGLEKVGIDNLLQKVKDSGDRNLYRKLLDSIGQTSAYMEKQKGFIDQKQLELEEQAAERSSLMNEQTTIENASSLINAPLIDDDEDNNLYEN